MSKLITLNSRTFTLKKNNNYTFPSKGLIHSWEIKDDKDSSFETPKLSINNYIVDMELQNPKLFLVSEIRSYIRNIDCPETMEENTLCNIEGLLYKSQIDSIEYYNTLSTNNFMNSIFNRDLEVRLKYADEVSSPEEVIVEEIYWDRKGNKEYDEYKNCEQNKLNKMKDECDNNEKDIDNEIQKCIEEQQLKPSIDLNQL